MILRSQNIYRLQNGIAALVFALLFIGEALAHLLHRFPGVEVLWRLTSISNRTVAPLLNALGNALSQPFLLIGLLAAATIVPLVAWRRRNWLATAASGHAALGALVVLSWWALKRANTGQAIADLSDVFEPRMFDTSVTSIVCLTGVMAILCMLNHLAFFGRSSRSQAIPTGPRRGVYRQIESNWTIVAFRRRTKTAMMTEGACRAWQPLRSYSDSASWSSMGR